MSDITTPAKPDTATPAIVAPPATPAAEKPQSPTLKDIAAGARAQAVASLEKILGDLPDPGDSGDLHLAGTRGQLKYFIDQLKLFPANA